MKEFFGFGGYTRPAEGFLSWQHLLFVGSLLTAMVLLAVYLGKARKGKTMSQKNKVLIWAAFLIDGLELFKILIFCLRAESARPILHNLPLFLCSIQLLAIPLAAFSKGRIKEAALDFVCIFGILGAVFGTIGAAQNYNAYPVLSIDNVVSGLTHCISGFASLYVMFARMTSMKRSNIGLTFGILLTFCAAAYMANVMIPYNYMFLMSGDGTPYDILYNIARGHRLWYPVLVIGLFLVYIVGFYNVYYALQSAGSRSVSSAKGKTTV